MPGIAGVGFGEPVRIGGTWTGFDTITGHGDFNGDGKVDLLVRAAGSSQVFVKPNRGKGRFGHALGPVNGVGGVTGLNAGASAYGGTAPDLLGRSGDTLVLYRNAGTYETGTPIPSGVVVPKAGQILSAGDWDRDGAADMIVRNAQLEPAVALPGRRQRTLRGADGDRHGVQEGQAARGRRRHDR